MSQINHLGFILRAAVALGLVWATNAAFGSNGLGNLDDFDDVDLQDLLDWLQCLIGM